MYEMINPEIRVPFSSLRIGEIFVFSEKEKHQAIFLKVSKSQYRLLHSCKIVESTGDLPGMDNETVFRVEIISVKYRLKRHYTP